MIRELLIVLFCITASNAVYAVPDCSENDFYTNQGIGNDNNDGTQVQPFATIQKLVLVLEQCIDDDIDTDAKRGFVVATAQPYTELGRLPGDDFPGISIQKGGNSSAERIIIEGVAGSSGITRPTIDQQFQSIGFFISKQRGTTNLSGHVTIRNFEIIHALIGIVTEPILTSHNNDIIIENNYIHHIYAAENIGAIRLDSCDGCVVRNNVLHDIYDTRPQNISSNTLNDRPYGMHSGIHGFEPGDGLIEKNLIFNVGKAVFVKTADRHGKRAHLVQNNIIKNTSQGAYSLQIQGAGKEAPQQAVFRNNYVIDTTSAVGTALIGASDQGRNLLIYNNTIIDTLGLAGIQSMENVEVFNNIHAGSTPAWGRLPAIEFAINADPQWNTTVDYFNNNLYFENTDLWVLDRNGPDELSLRQTGWLATTLVPGLTGTPDANALFTTPTFVDADNGDYTLQATTAGTSGGRGTPYPTSMGAGVVISSDIDSHALPGVGSSTQIGPDSGLFDDIPDVITTLQID